MQAVNHHAFDCEYQNEPGNDETAPFKNLAYWVHPCRDWVFYGAHDPSMGKRSASRDPSATLVGGLDRNHGVLDIVEAIISRRPPSMQIADIIRLQKAYNCLVWGIEIVQFQEFFKDQLVEQSRSQGMPVPARGIRPHDDKDLRILSMQPHMANGTVRSHKRHSVFNEQVLYYPEADHDDGPDAMQMLYMLAFSSMGGIPRIRSGGRRQLESYGYEY